jgi:hypothetical protein
MKMTMGMAATMSEDHMGIALDRAMTLRTVMGTDIRASVEMMTKLGWMKTRTAKHRSGWIV